MFVHSIVTSALTHETPSPLRKRKEVDLDIRNQEKGTKNKSGETGKKNRVENDSISIYSSFVCHFTALDTHSKTTRTGVRTSLSMTEKKNFV